MLISQLLALAMLVAVSIWVSRDARRRGMSSKWGVGVALMLIVFLPLYLLARKPVKCQNCGNKIPASLSLCEACQQLAAAASQSRGRPGRILG